MDIARVTTSTPAQMTISVRVRLTEKKTVAAAIFTSRKNLNFFRYEIYNTFNRIA